MKKAITKKAYEKAILAVESCSRPEGFFASGLPGGYEAVWSRDSMITSIGASLVGKKFKTTFKHSLETLARHQTKNGLIPNCVGSYNVERRSDITFNSIDAPLWYIIGHYVYASAYHDTSLLKKHKESIAKALVWLRFQDPNEDKLIVQQPTMDWMDAFPHKYGRVLNTQAQHYAVLKMIGKEKDALHIRRVVNGDIERYLSLWDEKLGHYRPWIWKDHDGDRESEEWFDSKANLLAIVTGLAKHKQAKSIIKFIKRNKIDRPYPVKALWPPFGENMPGWHSYFEKCDARTPLEYLNGGVWPFIGGLYVASLIKLGYKKDAEKELKNLASGVLEETPMRDLKGKYAFNEWLHGKTGVAKGEPYQAWTAGMYIYAYKCVEKNKVFYF